MNPTFKALSALLSYPTLNLLAALPEIWRILAAEAQLGPEQKADLAQLIKRLATEPLLDLEEAYVLLFDRSRSLSLHLFEHVHGEARDRGQAMVDLAEIYSRGGLSVSGGELPDYLPLFLEYLATLKADEAGAMLADPLAILQALGERLAKRQSDYAGIMSALVALAGGASESEELKTLRAEPLEDPNDKEAIDRAWEETMVQFGPGDPDAEGSCPLAREAVARMMDPDPMPEERSDG